jgi:uncharacterized protein YllA (UPF0747 family)
MAKKKITTFTHSELNRFVKEVSRKNLSVYLAASVEEWNLTKEDIDKWLDRLSRYMKAVDDHLITLADIERMIADELGHDIFKDIY